MPKPFTATGKKNLIGANLIALRKKYHLSQRGLAHELQLAGYDMDKNKEGERFGVKICHIDKLEETFPSDCKIAILGISENVQETVDRLMKLGIKGIVDFTHSHFMVQEGVEVQTVDVVVAIQELVIKMKSNDQE